MALSVNIGRKFYQKRNVLSIFLIVFLLLIGIQGILLFIFRSFETPETDPMHTAVILLGFFAFFSLLFFTAKVLEFPKLYQKLLVAMMALFVGLFLWLYEHAILIMVTVGVSFMVAVLFFVIYKRQGDGKSFGFATGLIFINAAGLFPDYSDLSSIVSGAFLFAAAILFLLGFAGVFEKKKKKIHVGDEL